MVTLGFPAFSAAGQDGLARARELYSFAAYDDALAALDGLEEKAAGNGGMEVAQYRAFCLFALGRTDEAKKVIEGMMSSDPFYRLSDTQASPRVQRFFQDVRRAALPGALQRSYAEAREALERKDPRATAQFDRVLALLNDPDLRGATTADFGALVTGFRDLSRAVSTLAATPPPAPAAASGTADLSPRAGNANAPTEESPTTGPAPSVTAPRQQPPASVTTPRQQPQASVTTPRQQPQAPATAPRQLPPAAQAPRVQQGHNDEAAVVAALRAYEAAYSTLDISAVIKVFPNVNATLLAQGFAQMKAQRVQILGEQLSVTTTAATVTCQVRQRFEPKLGRSSETTVNATFRLQKSGGVWVIVDRR